MPDRIGARSKARKRALDVLYEADLRRVAALTVLADRQAQGDPPVPPYAATLVTGVVEHQRQIDGLLAEHAHGWTLERMAPVDRNALRIGVYELLWGDDVPDAVAIDEAVDLVQRLSTDDSPSFVNGILGTVSDLKEKILAG